MATEVSYEGMSADSLPLTTLSLYKGTSTRFGVPPAPTNDERLIAFRSMLAVQYANTMFNYRDEEDAAPAMAVPA